MAIDVDVLRGFLDDPVSECRDVARWVAGRIAAGVKPEQIMVLARKREALSVLQVALRALGVAAEYGDRQLLSELPAVRDVLGRIRRAGAEPANFPPIPGPHCRSCVHVAVCPEGSIAIG